MMAGNPGQRAGVAASRTRRREHIEEWVFLTAVYGYSEAAAQERLGHADKTVAGYKRYLAEHPEVRLEVLAVYDDDAAAELAALNQAADGRSREMEMST